MKNLFDIVLDLEKAKDAIKTHLDDCNGKVDKATQVEFTQNEDAYRFKTTNWLDEANNVDKIGDIKTKIEAEVKAAIQAANQATLDYLYDSSKTGKEKFASVTGMQKLIDNAKGAVATGAENKEMSPKAATAFNKEYDEIAFKEVTINNEVKQVGKIQLAKDEIAKLLEDDGTPKIDLTAGTSAKNLVDQIAAINAKTLDLVSGAIEAVDDQLEDYKAKYKEIGTLKVDWSVAKADIANLYKKAHEADNSLTETAFEEKLDNVNKAVSAISEKLEKNAVSASTLDIEKELKDQKKELKIIKNYPLFVANNKAYDEANKLHKEVSDALAAAKTAVEALKDNVKAEFMPQLTAFDEKLAAENTALNAEKEDWTAQASNLAAVKTNLEAYKTQIANVLKAAQEANKVDESLDYNKDGEINDLDQRAAQDATIAGSIRLDTYFDWVNKFVDYQMNNK